MRKIALKMGWQVLQIVYIYCLPTDTLADLCLLVTIKLPGTHHQIHMKLIPFEYELISCCIDLLNMVIIRIIKIIKNKSQHNNCDAETDSSPL